MVNEILMLLGKVPLVAGAPLILLCFLLPVPISISFAVIGSIYGFVGILWASACVPVAALTLHALGLSYSGVVVSIPYVGRFASKVHVASVFPLAAFAVPFWPFFLIAGLLRRSRLETVSVSVIVSLPVALSMGLSVAIAEFSGLPTWALSAGALLLLVALGVSRNRKARRFSL